MLTRHDLANRYQVGIRTIDRWVAEKRIPVLRFSKRCLRFDAAECDAALRRFTVEEGTRSLDQ
jgi:predicted site-specific integrase-resolvase